MSCYSPLKAFETGETNTKSGKPILKILSYDVEKYKGREGTPIPCGKCIGCRLDYSREWAVRSYHEAKQYQYNYFVTLTYDPENLPKGVGNNPETGECFVSNTLFDKHLTKFIKDLRRYYEYHYGHKGIRFMASGEYGDKTRRPHYHLILYNLPINDLKVWKTNFNGDKLWNSEIIQGIWKKGQVVIANVSWETSAYVARYVMKKQIGKDNRILYEIAGEQPEFMRVSRNPGLGRAYFEANYKKMYVTDEVFINRDGKTVVSKPPAYYDRLYENIQPFHLALVKAKRKDFGENHSLLALKNTELETFDYFKLRENNKKQSVKFLAKKII